jgi:NADH:ubiquinone oxidoreductase subunit C/NADH:ubiquinone oxidoreductase subunit 3 (subunit A)
MYREFSALLAVWFPALALALVLFGVSFILVPRRLDSEKLSAYECGFDPFEDARGRFDVRFYLVAILFIVFDLEVSFLFPWSLVVGGVDLFGYVTLLLFLLVLTLGFLYEWFRGALDWLIFFFFFFFFSLFMLDRSLFQLPLRLARLLGGLGAPFRLFLRERELVLWVPPDLVVPVANLLRLHTPLGFDSLLDLTAVDRIARSPRFQLVYQLLSHRFNLRLQLRTAGVGLFPSLVGVFPAANWLEREVWDLFGLAFTGHPDLRRILTDYGFSGHPLRKDFPLVGFEEVRYDDQRRRLVLEPLEFGQQYRHFTLGLPWLRRSSSR